MGFLVVELILNERVTSTFTDIHFYFKMKEKIIFIALLCFGFLSCTKEKTDYLAEIETVVPDYTEFKEAASIQGSGYRVILEALNGTFYTGYNDIRLRVHRMDTDEEVEATSVTFLPIRWTGAETTDSAPHQYELTYDADKGYYSGYSVFTSETKGQSHWEVYISFNIAGQKYFVHQEVSVQQQDNKNLSMTEFTGEDGERYYIALIAPRVPRLLRTSWWLVFINATRPSNRPPEIFRIRRNILIPR